MMKANNQLGFININEDSIDKIIKDDEAIFERGFLREKTSTTLPITFGGVGKDLKDYRVYGNTVQSKLPDGYTQVDYIESSGTQYIDTGVNADSNLDIDVKMAIIPSSGTSYMGAMSNNFDRYHFDIQSSNAVGIWLTTGNTGRNSLINDGTIATRYKIFPTQNYYEVDGVQTSNTFPTIDTGQTFWLFGRHYKTPSYAKVKLYDFKMYYNGILVRDFISCYRNSDNEVGLYDLVNNVFYTNQGTGVFTYGSITPTPDAPIEMVSCGDRTKNLFNKNQVIEGYVNAGGGITPLNGYTSSNYIEIEPNTQYYKSESGSTRWKYYDENKVVYSSETTDLSNASSSQVFTTPANVKYLRFTMSNEKVEDFILSEGSTAASYEPYGYKIPINVRSDNIFSNNIIENGFLLEETGTITANSNYYICKETNIKPLNKYILSENQNYAVSTFTPVRVCAYDKDDNFIALLLSNRRTEVKRYVDEFVIPENTDYILIGFRNSDTNIELVESIDTNIYLDEPLRKIDEYSDYIDFINGKVVRNICEVILDGNETWQYVNNVFYSVNAITDYKTSNENICLCNKYLSIKNVNNSSLVKTNNTCCFYINTTNIRFYIRDERFTSISDFKEWLSQNNVTVDYVLATPTEESITLPNISTIDGNNTLNIETEITPSQVYIKYKSNT